LWRGKIFPRAPRKNSRGKKGALALAKKGEKSLKTQKRKSRPQQTGEALPSKTEGGGGSRRFLQRKKGGGEFLLSRGLDHPDLRSTFPGADREGEKGGGWPKRVRAVKERRKNLPRGGEKKKSRQRKRGKILRDSNGKGGKAYVRRRDNVSW